MVKLDITINLSTFLSYE